MTPQALRQGACFIVAILVVGRSCVVVAQQIELDNAPETREIEFFEVRIRPVLVTHCYECHSTASTKVEAGLRLDFREGLRKGGTTGPAIVPGKPEESLLIEALHYASLEMPPAGKLPPTVIANFEQWIRAGAIDPRESIPSAGDIAVDAWKTQLASRRDWWSLQPPKATSPPLTGDPTWAAEPVDQFVLVALEQAELRPAKPAEAEVLLRRLSFVLTGLPPSPEQVRAFSQAFAQDADRAMTQLVEELLGSPHFGERFARHWMDVVRYTDTYGYEWDIPAKGSWEYRDYLIRAFNYDVGFDQLIREQIAGDLLPSPRIDNAEGVNESLIGPMFYHLGEHRHGSSLDFNGIHQEMVNNKIDAFSKAFLAMTVACARCHDHKLDAVSQHDYYALAGVFMTPRWTARSIDAPEKYASQILELKRLRDQIRNQLAQIWKSWDGPLASGAELRSWALEHRSLFDAAKMEDIGHPIARLLDITASKQAEATNLAADEIWRQLDAEWRNAERDRRSDNETNFSVLTDFSKPGFPDGWVVEGDGIGHGYVTDGTPLISLDGETLIDRLLARGVHTHALSSKLSGAVRLPPVERFPAARVSVKLTGGQWAGWRSIPQNAFLSEGPFFFDPDAVPAWTAFSGMNLKNGVTRVLTEITTASLNANFPPRTGVAKSGKVVLPDPDEGQDKRSWFSITGIVAHDASGKPADTLDAFRTLYNGGSQSDHAVNVGHAVNDRVEVGAKDVGQNSSLPSDLSLPSRKNPPSCDEAWHRLSQWLRGAVDRWVVGASEPGDVKILNWLLDVQLLPNEAGSVPPADALVQRYREVEAGIAFPRSANSMDERGVAPIDYRLNVRGNVDEDGPPVHRNFLEVYAGKHRVDSAAASGRLELAEYLSSRDNPQTARVFVNRVWQWIFGTGIVATSSDFGKLGDRPSHPELLDWLAIQFMEEGWSTKRLVKRLVLSQVFRQGGDVSQAGRRRDPENRLLHHYPTRRLEAEAIRDSLLAVSGRLESRLYGRPINPPRVVEDTMKRLFSGPLDSYGRRSLYIEMSIMDPPKFLVGFNLPDLKLPTGRRDVTNVPAQALIMLNDPLVIQLAESWAERLVLDGSTCAEQRVTGMFIQALGRQPSAAELGRWTSAVSRFAQAGDLMADTVAWTELAHALFNTKEFIYYR